jgi:hypothetical protein
MSRFLIFVAMVAFIVPSVGAASDLPSDRVIQFLANAHTGQKMDANAWLLRDARKAERFNAYGGLESMVRQTSSMAHQYRGLRSIEVKDVTAIDGGFLIIVEVKFFDDAERKRSPAVAEREDMVWRFRVAKEGGVWKLAF